MAKLVYTYVCDPWDFNKPRHENIAVEDKWFDELKKMLRRKYPGEYVGELLKWQRADGYAVYVVARENPLEIAHVDTGDAYTVEAALIRGLNLEDVADMVAQERRWQAMFENNKEEKAKLLEEHGIL